MSRLEPAEELRGATCQATEAALKARLGADYRIASIGPAGEHLVRYATISHDGRHAGRGGSGAVLGSKNIKAIAVRGTQRCRVGAPARADRVQQDPVEAVVRSRDGEVPRARHRDQSADVQSLRRAADAQLSERHVRRGGQPLAGAAEHRHARTRASCVACTIGCEHIYANRRQNGVRARVRKPVRARLAVRRRRRRRRAPRVAACDELGIDTISTGGTIAFAMECVERGWLDEPWLTFGSGDALLRAIDLIGRREGLGNLLAEGSRRAAATIGHDSIAFAPQVKGLEIPGYEPRALQTMALGFAVGARGADHNRSGAYEVDFSDKVDRRHVTLDAVRHAIETEDKAALMDSLIICKFLRGVFDGLLRRGAPTCCAGHRLGRRPPTSFARPPGASSACKRQFNLLAGWTPAEDTLPERFLTTPLPGDPAAALTHDSLQELVTQYHRQRGWTTS